MTSIELMNNLAEYISEIVIDYSTSQKAGIVPIKVYSGWPPVRTSSSEKESFIYVLALDWSDNQDGDYSTCTVEIGFSIYDDNREIGWQSLYNIMEHIRQALLKKRTLNDRNRIVLPLRSEISDVPAFPQWQGKITATYTLGQPQEELIDYEF